MVYITLCLVLSYAQLSVWDTFIEFCRRENFKTYIIKLSYITFWTKQIATIQGFVKEIKTVPISEGKPSTGHGRNITSPNPFSNGHRVEVTMTRWAEL